MIDPGTYEAQLTDWGTGSSVKGTPYVWTKWSVEEESRTVYSYLSSKAFDISFKKLNALGFNGDFTNPDFEKKHTELSCTHEEYDGKLKERWDFTDWGDSEYEQTNLDDQKKLSLNAMWKNAAKDSGKDNAVDSKRAEAWEFFSQSDKDPDVWYETIKKNFPDKKEGDLTASDWEEIVKIFSKF